MNEIEIYIPQKPPFVMIGELVEVDETSTKTSFVIPADSLLNEGVHFSEAGLVENIAQTAAAGVGYVCREKGIPVPVGYIGAIKNLVIFALPEIGAKIETVVRIANQVFDVTIIQGEITSEGETIAQCEMKIFLNKNQHVPL